MLGKIESLLARNSDGRRGNGLKLYQRTFGLDRRRNFLTERVLRDWNQFSRDVVESPPLEMFQSCTDVMLRDTASVMDLGVLG